jgi:putative nucleotidyltransferase with HDIG domain
MLRCAERDGDERAGPVTESPGSALSVERLLRVIEIQNEVVATRLDLDEIMQLVAERAAEMTGASAAVLELPEGEDMVYRAATGSATAHIGLRLRIDASLSGLCLRAGVVLRCDDAAADPRVDTNNCRLVGAISMLCVPLRHRGAVIGVLKVYSGDRHAFGDDDVAVLEHLTGVIAAHMAHAAEFARIGDESRRNQRQALAGLRALARAIDAKDPMTSQHSERVAQLSAAIAGRLGWSDERVALLRDAALVHDVGKIGVPDVILLKPGRLTADEYALVKEHATLGASIVDGVLSAAQVDWVRWHHERPDGRGYPDGLGDAEIPEGAAIIALADAWDVMTVSRPYSPPKSREEALSECLGLVDRQFRARVLEVLADLV